MNIKLSVLGVSLVLFLAGVIGTVVADSDGGSAAPVPEKGGSSGKVEKICESTNYKEACIKTLGNVSSSDPKKLIQAGILAITEAVKKSFNMSDSLVVKAGNEPRGKMALNDCKELLNSAVEELHDAVAEVGNSDLRTLATRSDYFRTWLSSVIAYQEMCIDGFDENSPARAELRNSTDWGNKLTDNVLMLLKGMSGVLNSFGLKFNFPPIQHRRLLQDNGYPTWMSAADRKLLASRIVGEKLLPNAVVAMDGSGQFKTIQAAVNAIPKGRRGRYVIYVKEGVYKEYVFITKDAPNILMYGDGPRKTIVTGKKSFALDGLGTWKTATFIVEADGFIAKSMGFQNTAGPQGHQAVAIRIKSDMSAFYNCRMDGYQDTLLYQAGRQFYRNCVVSGTIDFLFGYGSALLQNCLVIVRRPMDNQFNTVTADGRKERGQPGGVVIHNCRIVPEEKLVPDKMKLKTYLGRPWKDYSRTVIMESQIGDFIQPEGWKEWSGNLFLKTLYYAEFANTGPGANTAGRVKWSTLHFLKKNEAQQFTAEAFMQGSQWIKNAGVPMLLGFKKQ